MERQEEIPIKLWFRQVLEPGTRISYRLLASMQPVDPERIWHGIVQESVPAGSFRPHAYLVLNIDTGYEGCHEEVGLAQIVEAERRPGPEECE